MSETIQEMTLRRDREIPEERREIAEKIAKLQAADQQLAEEHKQVKAVKATLRLEGDAPSSAQKKAETRIQRLFPIDTFEVKYRWKTAREKMHGDIASIPLTSLALRALSERFPEGTTTQRLHEFLETEWNRPQKVNSLQVTLSQLKRQGEIDFRNQLWVFIDKEATEQ